MRYFLVLLAFLLLFGLIQTKRECFQQGLLCEDCKTLVQCIQNPDGTFSKIAHDNCPHSTKCYLGQCTEEREPICDGIADITFPCQLAGIFPHPFYCDKYVMCVDEWGLKARVEECPEGYGYNIANTHCDVPLIANQCTEGVYPVPLCQNLLQSDGLLEDRNIYYRCEEVHINLFTKVLYPILNKCDPGETYDPLQGCR